MSIAITRTDRPATYQDVIDAPEHMVAEIIDDELHLDPRPRVRHGQAAKWLLVQLVTNHDRNENGGWFVLPEPELHLARHVLVPDAAAWVRPDIPSGDEVGITVVPPFVCEVLSPTTRRYDLTRKRDIYGEHGVRHLWFVDPLAQTLEVFQNENGRWTLVAAHHGPDAVRCAPF